MGFLCWAYTTCGPRAVQIAPGCPAKAQTTRLVRLPCMAGELACTLPNPQQCAQSPLQLVSLDAACALEQAEVEDGLYAAAEAHRLLADDGARRCWATITSGLSADVYRSIDGV